MQKRHLATRNTCKKKAQPHYSKLPMNSLSREFCSGGKLLPSSPAGRAMKVIEAGFTKSGLCNAADTYRIGRYPDMAAKIERLIMPAVRSEDHEHQTELQ